MKAAIPLLAVLSVFLGQIFAAEKSKIAEKPNIIVIFTDDHGWADLGAQGVDPDIRTPHTDQLARDGVRFTRGFLTAPAVPAVARGNDRRPACRGDFNGLTGSPDGGLDEFGGVFFALRGLLRDTATLSGGSTKANANAASILA